MILGSVLGLGPIGSGSSACSGSGSRVCRERSVVVRALWKEGV